MAGWKTIVFALALGLLGALQSDAFKDAVGGCIFEFGAAQPDSCGFPAWVVMAVAGVIGLLRFITKTSIFKGE